MKINGLNVDADKIGAGIYSLICEKGEEAIVAFGMIPKWAIDLLETAIRDKAIALAACQAKCTVEDFKPYVDEQKVKDTVQPIVHEVVLAIYKAADKAGKLVV